MKKTIKFFFIYLYIYIRNDREISSEERLSEVFIA